VYKNDEALKLNSETLEQKMNTISIYIYSNDYVHELLLRRLQCLSMKYNRSFNGTLASIISKKKVN
jgi:hypothetical protein